MMRVCLISVEIFAWGKYGGFGRLARLVGRELVKRGVQVTAVVPRRAGQAPVEELDGIRVLSFKQSQPFSASELFRQADAEIYHSLEPSMGTYLAQRAMPDRKHVVTFIDPRNADDWFTEFRLPSVNYLQVVSNWLYEDNPLVQRAARKADACYSAANMVIPKARAKYHLKYDPPFISSPMDVPQQVQKAADPTVCFVSRWDRRKRPEIFFEMVKSFPDVRFLAAGASRDTEWDSYLRNKYGKLPNLELLGFIDQFSSNKLGEILGQSWVLVNTAAREGLPNAFIEACAYGCAILSAVDPDGFASRFGYHAQDDNFVKGLQALLANDTWRNLGSAGYQYVRDVFSMDVAINQHLSIYHGLLGQSTPAAALASPASASNR